MATTPTLRGVDAKLARAREHLAQFKTEAEALLAAYGEAITEEIHEDGARHVYRLQEEPPIPPHWSALVGDVLHNLRCALDHLGWQLVLFAGGEPTKATTFPICEEPPVDDYPDVAPGLPQQLRRRIDAVQPYSPGVPDLRILRYLNNVDKHREVLPVVSYVKMVSWSVPDQVEVEVATNVLPSYADGTIAVFDLNPPYAGSIGAGFQFQIGLDPTALQSLRRLDPGADTDFFLRGDLPNWALGVTTHFVGQIIERFRDIER